MTSDYVSWVLGLQGWERAINEDSYMAGEEDVPDGEQVPCHTEKVSKSVFFCETGCQTPSEWLPARPAQQGKDAERSRAEPRKRSLQPGTTTPHPEILTAIHLSAPLGPN